ncbi:MAG: hypothetical protein NC177_04225 [Ruminococcus flavefaciens]|nr:hypothetical protein [Ruminococcus flavefaciens]
MRNKSFIKLAVGAGITAGMLLCSMTANATTIDDVARVARELGQPEETIQQGYNEYYANPGKYTEEDLDYAIYKLYEAEGIFLTTASQNPQPTTTTTTTTSSGGEVITEPDSPDDNNVSGGITLQMSDGSSFTRIPTSDFIKLSYDEKMDYIRSFTPEQQQVILDNLTPEEKKSIMKQLPVEQKAEVVDSMVNASEALGVNVSVEEISDDNISLSMRNDEGELVGMANVGSSLVEDTGYDRRGLFALSAGLIAVAGILLAVVAKYFRTGEEK